LPTQGSDNPKLGREAYVQVSISSRCHGTAQPAPNAPDLHASRYLIKSSAGPSGLASPARTMCEASAPRRALTVPRGGLLMRRRSTVL
jgi:hypothetical protein